MLEKDRSELSCRNIVSGAQGWIGGVVAEISSHQSHFVSSNFILSNLISSHFI